MIAQLLKQKTAHLHDEIERITQSSKIREGTFSSHDYKNLLYINGYIVNGFMDQIFAQLPQRLIEQLAFTAADKKAAIAMDAAELQLSIAPCPDILAETTTAYALGALYVMEGSMLGGNVIAKQLKKNEAFVHHGFHYFTFYKEHLGANWKSFLELLEAEVSTTTEQQSALNGATQIYDVLIAKAQTLFV